MDESKGSEDDHMPNSRAGVELGISWCMAALS